MAMIAPERVVFGSQNDIIDYVSRGMPPARKDFDRLMAVVRSPLSDQEVQESTCNDIVISQRVFTSIDSEEFAQIINRVYQNNVHNRNVAIASFIGGVAAGVFITAKICGGGGDEKEKD